MKKSKLGVILIAVVIMSLGASFALAESHGPAPNSGDGVSDGSGLEDPYMQGWLNEDPPGTGPAPNSGDGIPDGSGF